MTKRINATVRIRNIDEDTFYDILALIQAEAKVNHETFDTEETRTHAASRDTGKPAAQPQGRRRPAGYVPTFAPGA